MALATVRKSSEAIAGNSSRAVFDMGIYTPHPTILKAGSGSGSGGSSSSGESPPVDTTVMSPLESGTYPVLLFLHGYLLSKDYYTQIYQHIASHGYIIVAPQLVYVVQNTWFIPISPAGADHLSMGPTCHRKWTEKRTEITGQVEKFNGKNNVASWQLKMRDLLVQQGLLKLLLGKK